MILSLVVQVYQQPLGNDVSYYLLCVVFAFNFFYLTFFGFVFFKIGFPEIIEIFPRAMMICKKAKDRKELNEKVEM